MHERAPSVAPQFRPNIVCILLDDPGNDERLIAAE